MKPDAIQMPTEDDPVTVVCGDALVSMRTVPDASIDAVITDPPFCSGAATEAGRGSATHQGLRSETIRAGRFEWFDADNMTTSGLVWLLRSVAVEADRVLKPGGSLLVFCDWRMAFTLGPAMESAGFRQRNLIFWNKGHYGCGSGFRPQHEIVLHLTRRSPDFFAADEGNVIELKCKRVSNHERDHPTEKPVELFQRLMRVVAPPTDGRILDPFAGSGTAGVAALHEGLQAVLVEKSPAYCAIIRRRVADAQGVGKGSYLAPQAGLFDDLFAGGEA